MNLVAIEVPAAGVAAAREALELLDNTLRVVTARKPFEVIADQLIKTLAKGGSLLSSSPITPCRKLKSASSFLDDYPGC